MYCYGEGGTVYCAQERRGLRSKNQLCHTVVPLQRRKCGYFLSSLTNLKSNVTFNYEIEQTLSEKAESLEDIPMTGMW